MKQHQVRRRTSTAARLARQSQTAPQPQTQNGVAPAAPQRQSAALKEMLLKKITTPAGELKLDDLGGDGCELWDAAVEMDEARQECAALFYLLEVDQERRATQSVEGIDPNMDVVCGLVTLSARALRTLRVHTENVYDIARRLQAHGGVRGMVEGGAR